MKKILIIEDEKEDMFLFKTKFSLENFAVVEAYTIEQAWEKARSEKPDLILLDLVLKKQSFEDAHSNPENIGFHFLEKIKQSPELQNIPVVILTNLSKTLYEEKSRKLGASDFLVKAELLPNDIVAKVKNILPDDQK